MKEKSLAPALFNGLKLLEIVSLKGSLGFSQLQELSRLNISTLNRLLKTLLDEGYLQKNSRGLYILGPKVFLLSHNESLWNIMLDTTSLQLHQLSNEFGVTALLYAHTPDGFVVIDKVSNPYNVTMRAIGEVKPDFIRSPWGYLYLATLPETKIEEYYSIYVNVDKEGVYTPTLKELKEYIHFAKANKYSDDNNIILSGIRRIAAPIYDISGKMIASVAVGSMCSLLDEKVVINLTKKLMEYANEISIRLQGEFV